MEITICILLLVIAIVISFAFNQDAKHKKFRQLAEERHCHFSDVMWGMVNVLETLGMKHHMQGVGSGSIVRSHKGKKFSFNQLPAYFDGFYVDSAKVSASKFVEEALKVTQRKVCKRSIANGCYLTEIEIKSIQEAGQMLSTLIDEKKR